MPFELLVEAEGGRVGELIVRVVAGCLRVGDVINGVFLGGQSEGVHVSLAVDSIERTRAFS